MALDLERVAMLLHLKEQLMKHPNLAAVAGHVDVEIHNLNAAATKEELGDRQLTKEQEEQAKAAEEAAKAAAEADAKARQEAKVTEEAMVERRRRDEAQARGVPSEDVLKRSPPVNATESPTVVERRID